MKSITPTIPYSQHFRCMSDMIGNTEHQAVLQYLMDEYLCQIRTTGSSKFQVSINRIKEERHVTWRTAKKTLESLNRMGIIEMDFANNLCTFHGDVLASLVTAFYDLKKRDDKDTFVAALQECDFNKLASMGYELIDGNADMIRNLQGAPMLQDRALCPKAEPYALEHNPSANEHNPYVLKHNPSANEHNHMFKDRTPTEDTSVLEHNLMLVDRGKVDEIIESIGECVSVRRFDKEFRDQSPEFYESEDFKIIKAYIYGLSGAPSELPLAMTFRFFTEILMSLSRGGFCSWTEEVMSLSRTVNKEEEKIKKMSDTSEASIVIKGAKQKNGTDEIEEAEWMDEAEETRTEDEAEDEIEDNTQFPAGFTPVEVPEFNPAKIWQTLNYDQYSISKRKRDLQTFPKDEIEDIISDINNCLDRSDKIFIHLLWKYTAEAFEENDSDNEDTNSQFVLEGNIIRKSTLEAIKRQAIEDTLSLIEDKRLDFDDPELDVTAESFDPKDADVIFGWKEAHTSYDTIPRYTISKTFYDIYREKLPEVKKYPRRSKENREQTKLDIQYMQKINLIGDMEGGMDKLTPMEVFIYKFQDEYIELDPQTLEPVCSKRNALNYKGKDWMKLTALRCGIKYDDTIQVIHREIKKTDLLIPVSRRMFSADKIRRWNVANHFTSVVDQYQLSDFDIPEKTEEPDDVEVPDVEEVEDNTEV